jgi:choice-of-anchor C domain-containing protein
MRRRSVTSTMLALLATVVLAATAMAALFTNGSFENGDHNDGSRGYTPLGNGSGAISAWVVGGAGIDWIGSYWTHPANGGSRSLDLNASGGATGTGGSVSQQIGTTANATYVVTFQFAGNPTASPTCPNAVKTMDVLATGGGTTKSFSFDTTGKSASNMGWEAQGYSFVATGDSAILTFKSTVQGNCGPAIDMVVVTETLPTGAQCKKDGWKSMVDNIGNAFKNQGDCVSFYATGERNLANPKDDL